MDTASQSKLGAVRFGVFEVDFRAGELRKQGLKVKLQEQPFQVLLVLLERPGEVVTREELRQRIWPSDTFVDFDGGVYNAVKRLRDALGDTADTPRFVETIPRRGYRFIATVNGDIRADTQTAELPRWQAIPPLRHWAQYGAGALAVLVVVGILYWLNVRLTREPKPGIPKIQSVAVLPFASLSDDVKQGYFALGVSDAIITALARISALRVTSRSSVMQYADSKKPLPQIARELKVDGIVEGTVQRSGDRVRVTVQLVHGPSDQHLWADSFEAEMKDELALENNIAATMANQLQIKLTNEENLQLKSVRPVNSKALDAYLEARFHLDQARKLDLFYGKFSLLNKEIATAVSYLDHAIEEDPNYVPAYLAYFDAVDSSSIPQLSMVPRAKSSLEKALKLDESNIQAHLALARLLMQYEYDWAGAEREYLIAIRLNPKSADAHLQYAEYLDNVGGALDNVGDTNDAKRERQLAQALDPVHDYFASCCDGAVTVRMGMSLEQQRQIVEEKAPDDPLLIAVLAKDYAIASRFEEAAELYERSLRLYGWQNFADVLKRANKKGGPRFAIEQWMRAAEEYSKNHATVPTPTFAMAFTYASLGNKDDAFAWLDKAYEQRNWCIIYLKRDGVWDPLRSDPRFKELLRRVGLPR